MNNFRWITDQFYKDSTDRKWEKTAQVVEFSGRGELHRYYVVQ